MSLEPFARSLLPPPSRNRVLFSFFIPALFLSLSPNPFGSLLLGFDFVAMCCFRCS
ncbi:hypothetical protein B296_00041815 [Ensete ventricosum]|uniref:Uncharacterized protein n=1 Tax=Ensete ventricosum TaxID=4639 RepID=A0A426YIC6_ENSVE|nr:hypothetical protein B296_00041815 [Ensete ventricosum]